MGLPHMPTLGWAMGGQWGGIYGSPMERLGMVPQPGSLLARPVRRSGFLTDPEIAQVYGWDTLQEKVDHLTFVGGFG